jgi:hypothetical protein
VKIGRYRATTTMSMIAPIVTIMIRLSRLVMASVVEMAVSDQGTGTSHAQARGFAYFFAPCFRSRWAMEVWRILI